MKRSVALETTWFVILTIALVVLVEVFSQHFLTSHNREMARQQAQADLATYSLALQHEIAFYHDLLHRLSRRADVQNLLTFGDRDASFAWAQNYRKLLPDAVGLTLVNRGGEIQGNPEALLIGPMCRADIAKIGHGKSVARPAIHRERAGLEHFDLFAPVVDVNGEHLGFLFASFKLVLIQHLLEAMTRDNHKLIVVAADQSEVAGVDRITRASDSMTLSAPIRGTDWHLTLVSQPPGMESTATTLLIAASLLALLVGISVILLSRHLSKGLLKEMSAIHAVLDQIADGGEKPIDIQPHFRETAPLIGAVRDVSKRILEQKARLQQLSETDGLTGLLNRRRFNQELEKAWALAKRQVAVDIVALDLDGFKQLNDQYGHAAGDQVLKALADCLNTCTRDTDIAARLGGDEFVVLLIHSNQAAGLEFYERAGACFRRAQTALSISADMRCTLSAGLANVDPDVDANAEASLRSADDALYLAKHSGKNQIQQQKRRTERRPQERGRG